MRGDAGKLSCECVDVSGSTEGSGWNTYRAAPDSRACPDNLQGADGATLNRSLLHECSTDRLLWTV